MAFYVIFSGGDSIFIWTHLMKISKEVFTEQYGAVI